MAESWTDEFHLTFHITCTSGNYLNPLCRDVVYFPFSL